MPSYSALCRIITLLLVSFVFFFCYVTARQASTLERSPNLSTHHLPHKWAPHIHIMRAFTGLTSLVWCNKSRRVLTGRRGSYAAMLQQHCLNMPSPENKHAHSNQWVGQQSSNGHHINQCFQVKQESHDCYQRWKKDVNICIPADVGTWVYICNTIAQDFKIDQFHSF